MSKYTKQYHFQLLGKLINIYEKFSGQCNLSLILYDPNLQKHFAIPVLTL